MMLDTGYCAINTPKRRPVRPFQSSKGDQTYFVGTRKGGLRALKARDFGAFPTLKSVDK